MMGFEDALILLKLGRKVQRAGWNGKGMYLRVVLPYAGVTGKYVAIKVVDDTMYPWNPSQQDLFATDWKVVE